MRRDRNDRDDGNSLLTFGFVGPVVPEYSVGSGRVVLSVGFEDLLAIGADQRSELVGIKAGMMWVYFQVTDGLANLIEDPRLRRRTFEIRVLLIRGWRELNSSLHAYSLACLANEPR